MGAKNIYERFIWFDDRVRSEKFPNATVLAEQFEISSKTAQRDIDFMRDRLCCPLEYDASRKGYYYQDGTFSLPMIYLSPAEISSLLVARKLLQDIGHGYIGGELSSIADKITNVLNRHLAWGKVDENISFRLIEYSPPPEQTFRVALEGCLNRRCLNFTYYSPVRDETSRRKIDPYHLFNYMGTWHLIGHCHLRGTIRDFALGRISDARVLDETFERPSDFDVNHYFQSSFWIFKGKPRREVKLRFSPLKSRWIRDQVWHRDQEAKSLEDGSLELTFPVADFSEIKMEILKHGADVEVIRPKSLRKLIKAEAKSIAEIY